MIMCGDLGGGAPGPRGVRVRIAGADAKGSSLQTIKVYTDVDVNHGGLP
jgi:hypothetical protein